MALHARVQSSIVSLLLPATLHIRDRFILQLIAKLIAELYLGQKKS